MARKSWFTVQPVAMAAGGEKVLNVEILGDIGWDVDAAAFARVIAQAGDVSQINLSIHSPGGSVFDGWAVANILMNHPAKVTATVEGMAASMASVILLAADVRRVPENAYVMIHSVSGITVGDSEEMRRTADLLDKLQGDIVNFYAKRTGQDPDQLAEWMQVDTWMNGTEALERGFATEVLPAVAAAALTGGLEALDRRFANLPQALADGEAPEEEEEETPEEPEEEQEETPAEPDAVASHQNRISKIDALRAFLTGKGNGGSVVNVSELKAQLKDEREGREAEAKRAEAALSEVKRLKAQARDLDAVLEELGLSAAEASALPANSDEDEVLGVKERFATITDRDERRRFYQAHKAELEK